MKKGMIAVIIVIVLLCAGAGIGIYYYHNQTDDSSSEVEVEEVPMAESEKVFHSFIEALNKNDINKALTYLEPTEAQLVKYAIDRIDQLTGTNIAKVLSKWFPFLSNISGVDVIPELSPQVITVEEEEETSVITIAMQSETSVTFYQVYLIQIEGRWFIQYAKKGQATQPEENSVL
ncbi:MAG: hypothetical protein V3G42_11765 [Oscillospiraceae bacterium]